MVKTRLVQMGNSQGVRIPKALIQQLGLQNDITLEMQADALLIRAARPARFGWEEQFAAATLAAADEKEEADLRDFTNAPHLSSAADDEWEW